MSADSEGILPTSQWPAWWTWELELSAHLLKRMEERAFNEVELRRMLDMPAVIALISWKGDLSSKVGTPADPGKSLWNQTKCASFSW